MTIFIGFESANSYVKSVSSIESSKSDVYLNTLTTIDPEESKEKDGKLKHGIYEIDGEYYKVGMALKGSQNQKSSGKDGLERYSDPLWKVESLISIYKQLEQKPYHNEDSMDIVSVVTGVPTNHWGIDKVESAIKQQLSGTQTVNGHTFFVKNVDLVSQSESCFYDEILNEEGQTRKEFAIHAAGKDLLYIDIGHGTTDFCHIQDLIVHKRHAFRGMKRVWEELITAAIRKNPVFKTVNPDPLKLERILQETGEIKFNGVSVDVSEERKRYLQRYANEVIGELSTNLEDRIYDEIVFCGGGSIGLKPYLENAILNIYTEEGQVNRFRFLKNPQISNARGYMKFAINTLR